jgi:peptide/nickel transport system ATP-binding protein
MDPLLRIDNLSIEFDTARGAVKAVNESNLSIYPGQTVCLVGESGCGKSVTAMSILRLLPTPPAKYTGGHIWYGGRDLLTLGETDMRKVRGREIAMIFQEPMTSLNPVFTIGNQIMEAVTLHQKVSGREAFQIAAKALGDVGA